MRYSDKKTLATISSMLCVVMLCSCSVKTEKLTDETSSHLKNSILVEVCTELEATYPAIQLEKESIGGLYCL